MEGGAATSSDRPGARWILGNLRGEAERIRFARASPGQPGQRDVMEIDRAQPRRSRSRYIGSGLENVELRAETGAQVSFRDLERFIRVLHIARFGLENALGLLEIEKSAAHIGRDRELGRFQGMQRRIAPRARRLHPPSGRVAIEDMPGRIQSDHEAMVELRADCRIALAVNFVAGKSLHAGPRRAAVENQLLVLDLHLDLTRPDFRPGHVGESEAFVQVGMAGRVLQLPGRIHLGHRSAGSIHADQLRQAQLRILQARLGIDQLRLFVGQGDFRAADIQRTDRPGLEALPLRLQFFLVNADRLLAHTDLGPVQEHVVKGQPHIHRDAIDQRLVFERHFSSSNRAMASRLVIAPPGVEILHHAQRGVVVIRRAGVEGSARSRFRSNPVETTPGKNPDRASTTPPRAASHCFAAIRISAFCFFAVATASSTE